MAREDILSVLWPSQVTANSIFIGGLRQNNPFGNLEVCLVFASSFKGDVWGLTQQVGTPQGLQAQCLPDWDSLRYFLTVKVRLVVSDWKGYFRHKHMESSRFQ